MANQARAGVAAGSLVGVVFGLVFIEFNSGGLPGSWPLVVRVAGAGEVEDKVPAGGYLGRRYWNIVGLEGLALFGGGRRRAAGTARSAREARGVTRTGFEPVSLA